MNEKIIDYLNEGKIIIAPSDTVYGILANSSSDEVIKKVYNIKKRDYTKPLLLLMNNIEMVKNYTESLSNLELELISRYWPGPLTLILKKNNKVSNLITSNTDYVGIRIPNDENLLEIISKVNKPLISTSANISGTETITKIDELERELAEKVDLVVDGGYINEASSTIVRVENNTIKILREGYLAKDIKKNFSNFIKKSIHLGDSCIN